MDLELDDVESQIVESTRRFCARELDRASVRALADTGARPDRTVWRAAADQGWFSLRLPETAGGAGLGLTHATLLFEEIGRAVVPGPVLWSHLAATHLSVADAPAVAAGELVVAGVVAPAGDRVLIEDLDLADRLLVLGTHEVSLVDAGAVVGVPRAALDPTRAVVEVAELPEGVVVGDLVVARRLHAEGLALTAATAAGGSRAVTQLAVEHARAREQFGRPIGAFQAVKHLCADMTIRAQAAESLSRWAALHLEEHGVEASAETVAMAKLVATDAFLENCHGAIQVLGSMGYTWEHEAHLYLKRSHALVRSFATARELARAVGASLVDA